MSGTRSRSGSKASRSDELLAPQRGKDPRHISTSSTQGSLSIASYYYESPSNDRYDFTAPPTAEGQPSWPPNFDNPASSPTSRETAGTFTLHRRASSSVQRGEAFRSATAAHPGFASWASGLQLSHSRDESSNDSGLRNPISANPFSMDDTPTLPQITLSNDASIEPRTFAEDDSTNVFNKIGHGRVVSSSTEGDLSRYQYGQLADAKDSTASLQMGFGRLESIAGSLPNTPAAEASPFSAGDNGAADESEVAALTSNQGTAGWNRYGERLPDGNSTDIHSSEVDRQEDLYPSRVRVESPSELENGEAPHDYPSSSAAMYTHLADPMGVSRARRGLSRVGKSLRRISRRVVNLDGQNREGPTVDHIRLPDDDGEDDDSGGEDIITTVLEKQSSITPHGLRGKSLGIFGPDNPIRRGLAGLMKQAWVEPLILLLIILNVALLIVQSAPSVFAVPLKSGYFDGWIDYALLAVFSIFTIEVVARIIISGLIINPPAMYEPAKDDAAESDVASLPSLGHQRRKASRSNTLENFAAFGGTVKNRANEVLNPVPAWDRAAPISPNRAHPPRIVTADDDRQPAHTISEGKGTLKSVSSRLMESTPFAKVIMAQRAYASDYAYLRHSWNRIDFVAVLSFWSMFFLAFFRQEMTSSHHIYVFRALSVLRAARLLTVTSGTSTILQSLKTAGPLLVNVAFFTLFSMLLFSIIGIQAFKGSYRRSCVWVGDLNPEVPGSAGNNYTLSQICGGYLNSSGQALPAVRGNGQRGSAQTAKGLICPFGQVCVEADSNPNNDTQSFDNIFESLLQVIIVISLNGWSSTMYDMIDAEYFVSFLYFIFGILIMNFWMANLFVAVVINTFASITAETKQSAFAARKIETDSPQHVAEASISTQRRQRMASVYKRVWSYTKFFWVALIIADLGVQASQADHQLNSSIQRLDRTELYITLALDFEIGMRFLSYLFDNDWRGFGTKRNLFDLFLAVITSIIQIPAIHHSPAYLWLTVFQLIRFYRVIIAVPRMEALLIRVFGSLSGLVNMILFLFLMVGLATLIAIQLLRGDIPQDDNGQNNEINFKHFYNAYLGMYQIFSSENWTTVLYAALSNEGRYRQAVISAIFLCAWFLFANFIVLQMFIAVIAENFGVAESQKRAQQLERYLRKMEKPGASWASRLLHQLSPYRYLRERNQKILDGTKEEKTPGTLASKAMNALDEKNKRRRTLTSLVSPNRAQRGLNVVRKMLRLDRPEEQVPLDTLRARQFRQSFSGGVMLGPSRGPSLYENAKGNIDDTARIFARDRQLSRMRTDLGLHEDTPDQAEIDALHANRYKDDPRIAQAQLINTHPSYEKSLWIFSNMNGFRRTCQSFVPPSYGERLFGRRTSRLRRITYQTMILSAIAGSVIVAGVATPSYRRDWYGRYGKRRDSWFSLTEFSLSVFFILEFLVKVIADGFVFTPNAYLLSPWNALDLFVLLTLIINVTTELAVIGGVSRFTRALKAFRALRLINTSDLMRRAFSALLAGAGRFVDVSVLAILYIVPFAVWGQNLFSGLLYSCIDSSAAISTKVDCLGEFSASPSQWSFLAPRVWQNPTSGSVYSFDDFKSSLLILFEIVSLEGWTNVMATAMSITGRNSQLQTDARQVNALFFVIYNLVGAIFVLTLFVAVIIENFQEFSGAAYLTTSQRQWIDLKRLIARQRPSKRPRVRPQGWLRSWCYNRAVQKQGWWARGMTLLYIGSLITLATQRYSDPVWVERIRDVIYVTFATIFAADVCIRLVGLGWKPFRSDVWNLFDVFVVLGTLSTTLPALQLTQTVDSSNTQLQKIFLTLVAFKLVQRNNALNQLFKTAIASLPSIASLFLLWLVMFLVWGIMLLEVFGLTAWGPNETRSKNFSTLGNALVFLSLMSTGEGWNQYMHDFTLSPPFCTPSENYLETDCGSTGWAYFLFIGWNVISMYIFLNMFTGSVVENFSYVFQLGGKPKLSREQVRNFKQAWAVCDVERTGYMPKSQLVRFFNLLGGTLEIKMHPTQASIKDLKAKLSMAPSGSQVNVPPPSPSTKGKLVRALRSPLADKSSGKGHFMWPTSPLGSPSEIIIDGLNISALNRQLSNMDYAEVKKKKDRFERIYHEALLLAEQPANKTKGGAPFHDMLHILAHYKLINDEEALSLEELVERRDLQERIEDRIQTERVRGMLRLMWLRRRYLALRAEKDRLSAEWYQQTASASVPTISIDDTTTAANPSSDAGLARGKPNLTLDLRDIGNSRLYHDEPHTPPPAKGSTSRASTQHLSPSSRTQTRLLAAGNDEQGRSSIHLVSDEEHEDHQSLSPSPSLRDIEQRVSPVMEHIDASAWSALAKRLSHDLTPRSEHSDGRGEHGQRRRSHTKSSYGGGTSSWL